MFNGKPLGHQVLAQRSVPVVHNNMEGSCFPRVVDLSFIRAPCWFGVARAADGVYKIMKYTDPILDGTKGSWESLSDSYNDNGWKIVTRLVSRRDEDGSDGSSADSISLKRHLPTRESLCSRWNGYKVTDLNDRENAPELGVHDGMISAVRKVRAQTVDRMLARDVVKRGYSA